MHAHAHAHAYRYATLAPSDVLLAEIAGASPAPILVLSAVAIFVLSAISNHIYNICNGKSGLSAIPLHDYFSKKMRNAPAFEAVYS